MKRKTRPYQVFTIIVLLIGFSLACNLAGLIVLPATPTPSNSVPSSSLSDEAMITFQVVVPEDTPLDQPVFLNILDEVTGLALNVERHEMEEVDDITYEIDLPLPVGSVIKYRYAHQGEYTAEEHTSAEQPVRYRLYRVDGPGVVQDVVSAWSDTEFTSPTGRILGAVTDVQTGLPIPNLLVTAGGAQSFTASDGTFLVEGLPPGTHNLVIYALDGAYQTFQQGATIAPESSTPANIQMTPAPLVKVVFTITVPPGTMPAIPIRLAGNLYQLGNTFADLSGGMNTLASRMPTLTHLLDGRYSIALNLPAGADLQYKYTLGDGFWNAEHDLDGRFRLRRLIVPETSTMIEDKVDSWGDTNAGPLLFDITIPQSTPDADFVSIQFNPYGWTEPIPMWFLGDHHWVYVLYSPLSVPEKLGYRYCRNDQCGSADDALTPGNDNPGRLVEVTGGNQTIKDRIDSWMWLQVDPGNLDNQTSQVQPRGEEFITGVEFQTGYHPSWMPRMPVSLKEVQSLGANWIYLTPTWTYTRQNPPILEPVTGKDSMWPDLTNQVESAKSFGLNVGLMPTPNFPYSQEEWWGEAARDFAWWLVWFERYRTFILNHADLANRLDAQALVLGGDWVSPALPNGVLVDGSPSGVPFDAETRWRDLLTEVRKHYPGTIAWAMPATQTGLKAPPFLDAVDKVYLTWSLPLAESSDSSLSDYQAYAERYLDEQVKPFQERISKPVILAIGYPSADTSLSGCLPDPEPVSPGDCLDFAELSRPNPDIPSIGLDLDEQVQAYQALLEAINQRDFIDGFISRGYYPPATLQDKSLSVHGKPAGAILKDWYSQWIGLSSH